MRAYGRVVVGRAGDGSLRYHTLAAEPPLALRPTSDGLFLAAAAAGPLGGDETCLTVEVGAGAALRIGTVAATVALAGVSTVPSRWRWQITVGPGARLALLPEPTVVADGARHVAEVEVDLAADAQLWLREEVVLGRYGERGGHWQGRLTVRRAGASVLVQDHDVRGDCPVDRGPYGLAGASAFGTLLAVGTAPADGDESGRSAVGTGWARLPLAAPGAVLGVAVAPDASTLRRRLAASAQVPR